MSVIGDWNIDYVETFTNTTISFYANGYFFQHAGRYLGRWTLSGKKLTLKFDTLTLPNEPGPITLEAFISSTDTEFSGTKPNKAYNLGLLHYNARFLTGTPTVMPADGLAVEIAFQNGSMVTPTYPQTIATIKTVNNVRTNASTSTSAVLPVKSNDNDSPCQVRRVKSVKR